MDISRNWQTLSSRSTSTHHFQSSWTSWRTLGFLAPSLRLFPLPKSLQRWWRTKEFCIPQTRRFGNSSMHVEQNPSIGSKVRARRSSGLWWRNPWSGKRSSCIARWSTTWCMHSMKNAFTSRTQGLPLIPSRNALTTLDTTNQNWSNHWRPDWIRRQSLEESVEWRNLAKEEHGPISDVVSSPQSPWMT